jgi:FkbM family methyltransferase
MATPIVFHLYSPVAFEDWDWRSCDKGIGGSETSHIQMARHLASQGHEVITYAPLPDDTPSGAEWEGTKWYRLDEADWSRPGVWMLYRCPEALDHFDESRADQVRWLMFQDWDYPSLTPERVGRLHRAVVLCRAHERYLHYNFPQLANLTWVTRNGVRADLIGRVEAEGLPERNPKRVMYASSPDRGMKSALLVYRRAKEFVPDLELHLTYGFNNLNKLIDNNPEAMEPYRRERDECLRLVEETGAVFHGRLTQQQLYREWFKTGMTVYCTDFFETGWITGLEAQAMGAVPVFSPVYAQGENTRHGIAVAGAPKDLGTVARFAAEVVRLARDPGLQEDIRREMMPDVRAKWDWSQFAYLKPNENWVDAAREDLEAMAAGRRPGPGPAAGVRLPAGMCDNADEAAARGRWLKVAPDDVVFDVGAADGSWTFPAAAAGARVYAFDANLDNTHLKHLAKASGLADKVTAVRAFVTDDDSSPATIAGPGGPEMVPSTTLDKFAKMRDLARVDFVKIDVEGGELAVLRGAEYVLNEFRPRVMTEAHTETVAGVRVTAEDVTGLIDSLVPAYRHTVQPLTYDGNQYFHVFSEPASEV